MKKLKIWKIFLISALWVNTMNYLVIKKVIGKFKIEFPKKIWIIVLRSKMYAFKAGDDSKNKVKALTKS